MRRGQLLFVIGSDQLAGTMADGRPQYAGCTDLHRLFDKREPADVLRLDKHALRHGKRPDLCPYRIIVNLITDPDQNPKTLGNLKKVLHEYSGPVLNRPEAVLRSTRDQVARLLQGTPGLIAPKTLRLRNARPELAVNAIDRASMQFPLIVRKAGTHTGVIVGLVRSIDELRDAVGGPGEHIITEFVDLRRKDGVYRKYRVFFFGNTIIFRHMLASDEWSVHAKDRMRFMIDKPDLLEEEKPFFERLSPALLETLHAVRERMPLDYFGMDFGILGDGRAVLFEANATMNFFPFLSDPRLDHVRGCLEPAREAFHEMLGCVPAAYLRVDGQQGATM